MPIAEELQRLRASLDKEAAARRAAEEEAERVRMERQRLQKARDELASTLLVGRCHCDFIEFPMAGSVSG